MARKSVLRMRSPARLAVQEDAIMTTSEAPVALAGTQGYAITFRISRLADGRIQAAHKVRLNYHDYLGTQVLDTEYAGRIVGSAEELTPGPKLEQHLARFVARDFEKVPRPITARLIYEDHALDPAGRGEASFVVEHSRIGVEADGA
jgi:hypothetical protein